MTVPGVDPEFQSLDVGAPTPRASPTTERVEGSASKKDPSHHSRFDRGLIAALSGSRLGVPRTARNVASNAAACARGHQREVS